MADTNLPRDLEPIPLPVMGMTAKEYQTAFMYLDHANFAREVEESKNQRRQGPTVRPPPPPLWFYRYEFWAIILALASLWHAVFVQWVWPKIQTSIPIDSPWAPHS
ncbi:hypothetical protein GGS24DRAFT_496380 [Hypoxylon argillaceum]|nr:hypothetical protein GGS24DRAFT_496380 [Hypoxylon argillaceum]KAI1156073.1 hypothetical protein F4825DRAFT_446810 [Nemania diffusa]